MINNILYWVLRIPAILLLIIPFILGIPGFVLFLLSEEFDRESFYEKMNNDIKNNDE
jgi:Na+-driven multidrug efflux pump